MHAIPRLISAVALTTALLALPMVTSAQTAQPLAPTPTTLSLSATGDVSAAPDMATISFGVTTQAKTASDAMKANNIRMNAVLAALKAQGMADKDIQTSNLDLSAQYNNPSSQSNQPPVITGYQVQDQISVRVNEVKQTGPVIDAVISAGVNQIDSISFGIKNNDALLDQARQAAVVALTQRANLYATAAGLKIKRLLSLTEGTPDTAEPFTPMGRVKGVFYNRATPVSAGEVKESVEVSATFELEKP